MPQPLADALALRPPAFTEFIGSRVRSAYSEGERLLRGIERLVAGQRPPQRVLTTVVFTDIVGSTKYAATLGDVRWRRLLEAYDLSVRSHVAAHGGQVVKNMGDGYLVAFPRPGCAIRCARAMRNDAVALGLHVKTGIHTGECDRIGADLAGIAVHIGARVMASAAAGEILATGAVRDLVVGSGIEFCDRGPRELRGVPGVWTLHAVAA